MSCFCLMRLTFERTVCAQTLGGSSATRLKSTRVTRVMSAASSWRTLTWSAAEGYQVLYLFFHFQFITLIQWFTHFNPCWKTTSSDFLSQWLCTSSWWFEISPPSSVMAGSWFTAGGGTRPWSCLVTTRKSTAWTLKMDSSSVDPETKQPGSEQPLTIQIYQWDEQFCLIFVSRRECV